MNSDSTNVAGKATRTRRLSRRAAVRAGSAGLAAAALVPGAARTFARVVMAPPTGPVMVAAGGLTNPRGLAWDSAGTLYVALAGTGGPRVSPGTSPQEKAFGRYHGGTTASVAKVVEGCADTVAADLPSAMGKSGSSQGATALGFAGGQLYVLEDGAGPVHGNPTTANGVYRIEADGGHTLVADLSAWMQAHPVSHVPWDYDPDGETFGMVAGPDALWVVESNSGQVLRVTPQGAIARVADLSDRHPIPTGPALSPNGGVYVGFLTPAPYTDGASKVVEVTPDGKVTEVWSGLTMVTAVAVGADGTLYALEMATDNASQPPYVHYAAGKVVRRTGQSTAADVAVGLTLPIAMAFGPDHALYVSSPAYGAPPGGGSVIRFDIATGQVLDARHAVASGLCAATPSASPVASPTTGG